MPPNHKTRTITITSGKGGVGKTNISVNLAICLSALGHKTCLFDADLGLGNIDILLGLHPLMDLEDVIINHRDIQDIIIRNYSGIDIVPGSSGIEKIANIDPQGLERLTRSLSELGDYDFLLIDTSAGISKNVISFCLASPEIILLINPEPTSLTDAYALLKVLTLNDFSGTAKVIVNQIKSLDMAKVIYKKFKQAVQKHLHLSITLAGVIFQDPKVTEAVKSQQPLVSLFPNSNATKCIKHIAQNLLKDQPVDTEILKIESFWKKALHVFTNPVRMAAPLKEEHQSTTQANQDTGKQIEKKDFPLKGIEEDKTTDPSQSQGNAIENTPLSIVQKLNQSLKAPDPGQPTVDSSPIIEELIRGISSVSEELQLIRKGLEDIGLNRLSLKGIASHATQHQPANRIVLDFEAFQKQRKEIA